MYKYVLIDADNTLLDFDLAEKCAFRETIKEFPLEYTEKVYERYHLINDNEWKRLERGETTRERLRVERYEKLYYEFGLDGKKYAEQTADLYVEKLSLQAPLMENAEKLVSYLSQKYTVCLVTNGTTSVQKSRMARTPLEKYITHTFISQEMGCAKPELVFFEKVMENIGDYDKSSYIVIGDSLSSDIAGAVNAGLDSIWLCLGDKCDSPSTYTVKDLLEICEII